MSVQDQVAKSLKLVGRVLGDKFKLTACIGIGGSGAVYKADQIALGRTVAVKILNEELSADTRMISRFRGEAMSASRLNHPNCVSIIDYGQAPDGLLYLAMEYVKGPTLTQLLVNETPLDVDRVLDIISQTLHGIEEAHLAGVIHADLKADNIILDQRRAGTDTVKIVDFGIARLVTGVKDVNEDRSISGTPEYMAPEVISGAPPSFASDVYAVGIILYELLAERTPFFAGSTTEILTNHLKAQPQSLALRRDNVPATVDVVMTKALAKHPTDRYTTAAEMREAVMQIRARMRNIPTTDKCVSCSASCQPTWKYCPECGTPRVRVSKTFEIPTLAAQAARVLPLPFAGRSERARHADRPHEEAGRPCERPARDRQRGRGPLDAAAQGVRSDPLRDPRRLSDRSGSERPRGAVLPDSLAARGGTATRAGVDRGRSAQRRARDRAQRARRPRHRAAVRSSRRRCSSSSRRSAAARWCGRRCARSSGPRSTIRRRSCARTSIASIIRASRSCAARPSRAS